jgi:hypothetical protein
MDALLLGFISETPATCSRFQMEALSGNPAQIHCLPSRTPQRVSLGLWSPVTLHFNRNQKVTVTGQVDLSELILKI